MSAAVLRIETVDPQGPDAMALLDQAAIEARELYPDLHLPGAPAPTNPPTPTGGCYLLAYLDGVPVACGALRPIDQEIVEVRRMFVLRAARRQGLASKMLGALEQQAQAFGYQVMRLETGNRQQAAMALYTAYGFKRIAPFADYVEDPVSVCYEKRIE